VRFDVLQDRADANHFFFHEVYRDEAALQAHTQTPHFARWSAVRDQVLSEPAGRHTCTVSFPKDYK
jgi:autoinducer 2-degrading protein